MLKQRMGLIASVVEDRNGAVAAATATGTAATTT